MSIALTIPDTAALLEAVTLTPAPLTPNPNPNANRPNL